MTCGFDPFYPQPSPFSSLYKTISDNLLPSENTLLERLGSSQLHISFQQIVHLQKEQHVDTRSKNMTLANTLTKTVNYNIKEDRTVYIHRCDRTTGQC